MKTVQMEIRIQTGLPNYSSRSTSVTVVADEGESLDIVKVTKQLAGEINKAWSSNGKKEPVKAEEPKDVPMSNAVKDILG